MGGHWWLCERLPDKLLLLRELLLKESVVRHALVGLALFHKLPLLVDLLHKRIHSNFKYLLTI